MVCHRRRKLPKRNASTPFRYKLPELRLERAKISLQLLTKTALNSYLKRSMKKYLENLIILTVRSSTAKNLAENLETLRKKQSQCKSAPRGILENVDMSSGGVPGRTSAALIKYKLKACDIWNEYVQDNFEDARFSVTQTLQPADKGQSKKANRVATSVTRACIVPMAQLIRSDLPVETRQNLLHVLENSIKNTSEYFDNFSALVFSTMLSLQTFSETDDNILSRLIPSPFFINKNQSDLINRIDIHSFDEATLAEFNKLFSIQHLQFMNSCHFSTRGLHSASSKNHPLWQRLSEHVSKAVDIEFQASSFPSHMKQMIIQKFEVNMKNMWADKRILKLALDRLLLCLLRLHLAPKKEKDRLDSTKTALLKKKTLTCETAQFHQENEIAKNKKRSLIKQEIKKSKYEIKSSEDSSEAAICRQKVEQCQKRMDHYKSLVT